jgi:hypothetical protein
MQVSIINAILTGLALTLTFVPSAEISLEGKGFKRVNPFGKGGFFDLDCFLGDDPDLVVVTGVSTL